MKKNLFKLLLASLFIFSLLGCAQDERDTFTGSYSETGKGTLSEVITSTPLFSITITGRSASISHPGDKGGYQISLNSGFFGTTFSGKVNNSQITLSPATWHATGPNGEYLTISISGKLTSNTSTSLSAVYNCTGTSIYNGKTEYIKGVIRTTLQKR